MATTRSQGQHAEVKALEHLRSHGCQLIVQNYNTKGGEIDLIVDDSGTLVFVEVRFRRITSRGSGAETVTSQKIRKIIRTAKHFLVSHKHYKNMPCRFDVVSMSTSRTISSNKSKNDLQSDPTNYSIDWIKRAFTLDT
jgi:putative endonuclease